MNGIDTFAIQFSSNPLLFLDPRLVADICPILEKKNQDSYDAGYEQGVSDKECEVESISGDLDAAQSDFLYIRQEVKEIHKLLDDGEPEASAEKLRELLKWLGEL